MILMVMVYGLEQRFPESGGHFTILNGNCSDWSCKEDISGQPCADLEIYNDKTIY